MGGETGFMLSQPLLVSCVACGVQHNGESGSGNPLQEVLPHYLFVVVFLKKKAKHKHDILNEILLFKCNCNNKAAL